MHLHGEIQLGVLWQFPWAQGHVLPSWKPQAFRELIPPAAALSASVAWEQRCFVLQLFYVVPAG